MIDHLLSEISKKVGKHGHLDFPEPNTMSSDCFFCSNNSPKTPQKHKNSSFTFLNDTEKQQIIIFKKLNQQFCLLFYLKNVWKDQLIISWFSADWLINCSSCDLHYLFIHSFKKCASSQPEMTTSYQLYCVINGIKSKEIMYKNMRKPASFFFAFEKHKKSISFIFALDKLFKRFFVISIVVSSRFNTVVLWRLKHWMCLTC